MPKPFVARKLNANTSATFPASEVPLRCHLRLLDRSSSPKRRARRRPGRPCYVTIRDRPPPPSNIDHSLSESGLRSLMLAILSPPELREQRTGGSHPLMRQILPTFLTRSFLAGHSHPFLRPQPRDIVGLCRHLSIREMLQFCVKARRNRRRNRVLMPQSAPASYRERMLCRDVIRIYAERPGRPPSVQGTMTTPEHTRKNFLQLLSQPCREANRRIARPLSRR